MNPATKFVGNINPFTGERIASSQPRSRKTDSVVSLSGLEIRNDQMPRARPQAASKYEPIFSKLLPGQCVRCTSKEVGTVSGSLKKYIKTKRKPGVVKSTTRYIDPTTGVEDNGYGRVWLKPVALKVAA